MRERGEHTGGSLSECCNIFLCGVCASMAMGVRCVTGCVCVCVLCHKCECTFICMCGALVCVRLDACTFVRKHARQA